MFQHNRRMMALALGILAAALLGSAACGGGATSAPAAQTSPGSGAASAATAPASNAPAGPASLTLVASNMLFDKAELKAAPGAVTITIDNQDTGIPHNLQVFKGSDNSGQSLAKTEVVTGPAKHSVTLELQKGTYFYQCDVHPTTMTGKLIVG